MNDPVTYKDLREYLEEHQPHDYEAIYNVLMDTLLKLSNREIKEHQNDEQ